MVALFGRLLKILPFFGAVLVIAAIGISIYREQMDQFAIALTALGFIFFLAMFLKIETASLRYYLNLSVMSILMIVVLALIYLFAQVQCRALGLHARVALQSFAPDARGAEEPSQEGESGGHRHFQRALCELPESIHAP